MKEIELKVTVSPTLGMRVERQGKNPSWKSSRETRMRKRNYTLNGSKKRLGMRLLRRFNLLITNFKYREIWKQNT